MDSNLVAAIGIYCTQNGFQKTQKLLSEMTAKMAIQENKDDLVVDIFEKYFQPKLTTDALSFTFKLSDKRKELRKRIETMEGSTRSSKPKKKPKMKISETADGKIPNDFLMLLDELGLHRKDATKLYENKEHWNYVKSDRKIYCTVRGKSLTEVLRPDVYFIILRLNSNGSTVVGCDYETILGVDCLTEHCTETHKWGRFPCTYDYCKYQAYSQKCYKEGFIFIACRLLSKNYIT